jgi:hypothetical protein
MQVLQSLGSKSCSEPMEVDDIIQAVAAATFTRESLRLVNVTRKARRAIGNGAAGISDIEGKVARVATSQLGSERVSTLRNPRTIFADCLPCRLVAP